MGRRGSIFTRAVIIALFPLASAEHHGNLEDPTLPLELKQAKARIGELEQALHKCRSALHLLSSDEDGADKVRLKGVGGTDNIETKRGARGGNGRGSSALSSLVTFGPTAVTPPTLQMPTIPLPPPITPQTDDAVATLGRQLLAATEYEMISSGQCKVVITSMAECAQAAAALKISLQPKDDRRKESPWRPPGCYKSGMFNLYLNVDGTNTRECGGFYKCLCKRPTASPTAFPTFVPTTPSEFNASTPTVPPTLPPTETPTTRAPTRLPTPRPTLAPTLVPTVKLTSPDTKELLRRCNLMMNTTFYETGIKEVDISNITGIHTLYGMLIVCAHTLAHSVRACACVRACVRARARAHVQHS